MIWITGNSGAGKTTLARKMAKENQSVVLDGDDMRSVWTLGFTVEDRWEQNLRVAKLGKILEEQGFNVIVSTICPYRDLREKVKEITGCEFIFLEERGHEITEAYPYER